MKNISSNCHKILALDTSLSICTAALLDGTQITEQFEPAAQQHGEFILQFIQSLLQTAKLSFSDLDALAVTIGPGSFTGVRLAASIAQAIAYAHSLPVVLISTLQAMAQTAYHRLRQIKILACLDARMQEVYWSGYELNAEGIMVATIAEQLSLPNQAPAPNDTGWYGIGDGWKAYDEVLQNRFSYYLRGYNSNNEIDGKILAQLGQYFFQKGITVTAENVIPNYLRNDQIWKKSGTKHYQTG